MGDAGVQPRKVEKVSNIDAKFSSFKVEIKITDVEKVIDANFWPTGIYVRMFYTPKT